MRLNISSRFPVVFVTLVTAITLLSCGGDIAEESTTDPADSTPTVQGEPIDSEPGATDLGNKSDDSKGSTKVALDAGSYCYRTDESDLQAIAEFLVEPDQSVTGTLAATVTDEVNAYYTSYDQTFAGELEGDSFTASITTNIEDDVQQSTETWTLNDKQFSSDSAIFLERVDCEEIIALKANQKADTKPVAAAPATTPPPTKTPAPATTPAPAARPTAPQPQPAPAPSGPITVQFDSGETETVMKGSLASGQQQTYLVGAQEGQDMYLELINGSGKALFDVEVDNGEYIEGDLPEFIEFTLPFSGTYIVTVKASENNTNYALTVRVQ